ncbi:hypothetical protein swp_2250 [Shewanella piezotolerans WP3]|uniref:Uncharacterized protein n=1 Tax=Shewanella piezotolerans (strain WP3 / JCM 13877) TaxID=225849 RepID=B8CNN0_SHEPW|nr:hypothetical protein swp_2250 [Shewanella piezotolerans WP3]
MAKQTQIYVDKVLDNYGLRHNRAFIFDYQVLSQT